MTSVAKLVCLSVLVKNCLSLVFVNNSYVRTPRQIHSSCVLPQHPNLGRWTIYQATSQLSPGQNVPPRTVLQINCRRNSKIDGDTTIVCIDGEWTTEIGQCLRTCPSRYSTPIMNVTCTYNDTKLKNCDEPIEGTRAQFQCADFYEDLALERHPVHFCRNGIWSHHLPECVPICGQKSVTDPRLIVRGNNVTKGDFPWQVALYNVTDKELLCGGTLVNQRVVVTAAHCVTNDNGQKLSKQLYMVAVGKYYRKYDHPNDISHAQFSPIHEIYIPRQYKGDIQNYFGDIAILITKGTFYLSTRVLPVCVDWALKHREVLLDHTRKTKTFVTGWGFTAENKNPAQELKELEVSLVSDEQCNINLPEDYTKFLTDDKLCAGFLEAGKTVCKGDSGGGLVTRFENRYYIIGVVSLSPQAPTQQGGCNSQQFTLYTKIHYYIDDFLLENDAAFRPSTFENMDCEDDPNCRDAVDILTTTTTTSTTTTATVVGS